MYCHKCGKENSNSSKYCVSCGAELIVTKKSNFKKTGIFALIFAVIALSAGIFLFNNGEDSDAPKDNEEEYVETIEPVNSAEPTIGLEDVLVAPAIDMLYRNTLDMDYYKFSDCDDDGNSELLFSHKNYDGLKELIIVDLQTGIIETTTPNSGAGDIAYYYDPQIDKVLLMTENTSVGYNFKQLSVWTGEYWYSDSIILREDGVLTQCNLHGHDVSEAEFTDFLETLIMISVADKPESFDIHVTGSSEKIIEDFKLTMSDTYSDAIFTEGDFNSDGKDDVIALVHTPFNNWEDENYYLTDAYITHFAIMGIAEDGGMVFKTIPSDFSYDGAVKDIYFDGQLVVEAEKSTIYHNIDATSSMFLEYDSSKINEDSTAAVLQSGMWHYNGLDVGDYLNFEINFGPHMSWGTVYEKNNDGDIVQANSFGDFRFDIEEKDVYVYIDFENLVPCDYPTVLTLKKVDGRFLLEGENVVMVSDYGIGSDELAPPFCMDRDDPLEETYEDISKSTEIIAAFNACTRTVDIFMDEPFPENGDYTVFFCTSACAFVQDGEFVCGVEYGAETGRDENWYYIFEDNEPVAAVGINPVNGERIDLIFEDGEIVSWSGISSTGLPESHDWVYDAAINAYEQMAYRVV